MVKLGIIGGTSLLQSSYFASLSSTTKITDFGSAVVHVNTDENDLFFVQRHHADGDAGAEVYRPPHLINHRANLSALAAHSVDAVIAVCSVGSLSHDIRPGTLLLPDDYFYLFGPPFSMYDDQRAHVVPGIDKALRSRILAVLKDVAIEGLTSRSVVYMQTTGPRFETPAEVRFLTQLADVVGMTGAHEATAARELGLPYAIIAMVDNMANGLDESTLTKEQFKAGVKRNQTVVEKAVEAVVSSIRRNGLS